MAKIAAEGSITIHMNMHKQKADSQKIAEKFQETFKSEPKTEE